MQVSIVSFSNLEHSYNRMDAEYYQPIYLELDSELQQYNTKIISSVGKVTDGEHGNVKLLDDGVKYLTAENIKKGFVSTNGVRYVSKDVDKRNKRARVCVGDILVSIKGTLGTIAVAEESLLPANMNRDVAIIKPNNNDLNSEYIAVFLMSRMGNLQAIREASGGVQQMITLGRLGNIKIPILSNNFQLLIKGAFEKFNIVRNKSLREYGKSEKILLSELGLTNWQPKHQLTFIKKYSDTEQSGRIDAEYYQPKYDDIINVIKNYSGGWDRLDKLVRLKKCIEVGSGEYLDEGIPFVRVSNISPFELSEEKYISESLYNALTLQEENITFEKSKNHQPKQGEILFSKDGTPGIAFYLKDKPQNMIPSSGILRLQNRAEKVNNEYLTLVLNSILTQEQVNRDVGGSIIQHWRPDQVKETAIPILSEQKQLEIQQKVTESFNLRKQSNHLLECAKKAVEMAIEQDEQKASQWLENEVCGG